MFNLINFSDFVRRLYIPTSSMVLFDIYRPDSVYIFHILSQYLDECVYHIGIKTRHKKGCIRGANLGPLCKREQKQNIIISLEIICYLSYVPYCITKNLAKQAQAISQLIFNIQPCPKKQFQRQTSNASHCMEIQIYVLKQTKFQICR